MSVENKSLKTISALEVIRNLQQDIKIARRLIETPGYFYQQPTIQQEEKFKEDYFHSWEKVSKKERINVPKTINTYFGKIEIIKDAMYFKSLLKKYKLTKLPEERKKAYEKLDSLSSEELIELQAKIVNIPLQMTDFSTGRLSPVT